MNTLINKIKIVGITIIFLLSVGFAINNAYADPGSSKGFADFTEGDAANLTAQENEINANTTESNDNYLKSLSVDNGSLSPTFYRGITEYTVDTSDVVDKTTLSSINVSGVTEDDGATVKGLGKIDLNYGDNTIKIVVTAKDKSTRTYTIKVNRPKIENSNSTNQTIANNTVANTTTNSIDANSISNIVTNNTTSSNIFKNINFKSAPVIILSVIILLIVILVILLIINNKQKKNSKKNKKNKVGNDFYSRMSQNYTDYTDENTDVNGNSMDEDTRYNDDSEEDKNINNNEKSENEDRKNGKYKGRHF